MADTDLPNGFGAIDRPRHRPPRPIASPFGMLADPWATPDPNQTPGFNVQPEHALADQSDGELAGLFHAIADRRAWPTPWVRLSMRSPGPYTGWACRSPAINSMAAAPSTARPAAANRRGRLARVFLLARSISATHARQPAIMATRSVRALRRPGLF